MSRMIFAGVLAGGMAFALGCDKSDAPPPPPNSIPNGEPAPPPAPKPDPDPSQPPAPKAESPKVAWETDLAKHAIPDAPVKGTIAGVEVTPQVEIEGDELRFQVFKVGTPIPERGVKVKLAPMTVAGEPMPAVAGKSWKVAFDGKEGPEVPHVFRQVGENLHFYPVAYAMTLELGPRKDGKVAGKIYLSLPDDEKLVLAGTFAAEFVRPHTEKPGPDDAPFISGEITVAGAEPKAEVRVTAFTPTGAFFKELAIATDSSPAVAATWTRDDNDKPRVSTLLAGDGKARPFRYEHVKLSPGRYLISAAIVGGPAQWKWVDLAANGTVTQDFALDATKSGGVEVTVPADAKGKVFVAPADEGKPALDADLFHAISLQVVRQEPHIVGGKALIKNLAPGKYEVRAGELRGTVEVVAGKTAELKLTPTSPPDTPPDTPPAPPAPPKM